MRGTGTATLAGMLCALFLPAAPARTAEVHGNVRVTGGTTEAGGMESDVVQQDYRITFFQPLVPFLSVNVTYRHSDDRATNGSTVERSLSSPEVVLQYSRQQFVARFSYLEQRNSGTSPTSNFDLDSAVAYLSYRPKRGPSYVLQYRDESNVADTSLFGRNTDSSLLQFDTVYDAERWSARFTHLDSEIDNNATGFRLDQVRDQLRADYLRRWDDGRYSLNAETWVSRVEQTQVAPTGAQLAQPVPAFEGLFEVDLSPSFGALSTSNDLIDSDTDTPALPQIEIGGALTGRNVGVDLGATQPVTRLEIYVDATSDATLLWEVYHGPDNFNWTPIPGVIVSYDAALDRYALEFPETTDRYFKAVNVSVNSWPDVSVTEMRALVDVDELGRSSTDSEAYRLDLLSNLRPHDLVRGNVRLYLSNDESLAGGLLSQETDQLVLGTNWTVLLGHDLEANLDLRYSDFERRLAATLEREVRNYSADLTWRPRETVRGIFEVTRRDETSDGVDIRDTEQVRVRLDTEIYPTLSLGSELSKGIVDDVFGGFGQIVVRWTETLQSQPTPDWRLGGSTVVSWYDSVGIVTVSRRVALELFTNWRIFPFLTFNGLLTYTDDEASENLHQRYALSWAPGRKFAASIYFQDSDAVDTRRVTSGGGSVSYRLNRGFTLFANASRSRTEDLGVLTTEVTSARLGLRATF